MPDIETIAGVRLIAEGDRIVSSVRNGEPFEPASLARWSEICSSGGTVLDVGAYTGLFAIIAAKRGCRVKAFEPLFANVLRCRENAEENAAEIQVIHAAMTDAVGPVEFNHNASVKGLTSGGSLLEPSGMGVGARSVSRKVRGLSIDSLELEQVTAIKIDVERAEPLVLKGALETLARCQPMLLVEVLGPNENYAVKKVLNGHYREAEHLDGRNVVFEPC